MRRLNLFAVVCRCAGVGFSEKLPPLPEHAFTYVVIPDTQRYLGAGAHVKPGRSPSVPLEGESRNPAFESRVDWIVNNVDKERIVFVSHTGDIIDVKNDFQWSVASNLMSRLDGVVPYGISLGNHDLGSSSCADFNRYFPRSRYEGRSWYAGAFDGYMGLRGKEKEPHKVCWGNADSCQLVEMDGCKFVFLHLECNAPAPVLKWADAMLDKYADRIAVVCTHMFLGYKSREVYKQKKKDMRIRDDWFGVMEWSKCHGRDGMSADRAWETCFARHKNLLLVICGDQGPVICWREKLTGVNGNVVHGVLQDYPRTRNDEDWLRLFRFRPRDRKIDVWTYSPQRDEVCQVAGFRKNRADHVFTLDY